MNGKPRFVSLSWAAGGIIALGLVTRFIGLGREILIAGLFGTSPALDAIYLGLSIPLALCLGIGGGIARAVVPMAAAASRSSAGPILRRATYWLFRRVMPLSVGLAITSPLWTVYLVTSNSQVPYGGVLLAGLLGSFALCGGAFAGLAIGVANAREHHVTSTSSRLLYNLIVIGTILLLHGMIGAYAVLVGVVLAEWGQVLALHRFLKEARGAPIDRAPSLDGMAGIFLPAAVLAMAGSAMGAVDKYFAQSLGSGSVAGLAYAERLLNFPVMLIGVALSQPIYTRLARLQSRGMRISFDANLELGVRLLMLTGAPMTILLFGLAEPIVAFLLQRGAFSAGDTAMAASALRGYAFAVIFLSAIPLFLGAALAKGKAWLVASIYLFAIVANGVLDAIFVREYGLFGIALVTSIVAIATASALVYLLDIRFARDGGFGQAALLAFATIALGGASLGLFRWLGGSGLEPFFALAIGGGIFALAHTLLLGRWTLTECGELRRLARRAAGAP